MEKKKIDVPGDYESYDELTRRDFLTESWPVSSVVVASVLGTAAVLFALKKLKPSSEIIKKE